MASRDTRFRETNKRLQSEINYRALGLHMRDVRKARNFTQDEVCEILDMDPKYYSTLENGKNRISLTRFIQFAWELGASADFLISGCHPKLMTDAPKLTCGCEERRLLSEMLDQCSNEMIQTMYSICKVVFTSGVQSVGVKGIDE